MPSSSLISLSLLFLLSVVACWSTRVLVDGATTSSSSSSSLNPFSIGIRSAIARRPGQLSFGQQSDAVLSSRRHHRHRHRHPLPGGRIDRKRDRAGKSLINNVDVVELHRGGAAAAAISYSSSSMTPPPPSRRLHFWEAMICGAISRAAAQTIMHPANTMKTILQSSRKVPGQEALTIKSFTQWKYAKQLTRGAGAQLILSIPHGAVNFAVLELVRRQMNSLVSRSRHADSINRNFGPGMDFVSSAISTICCSVVSTPQMMICDNVMSGTFPHLSAAVSGLMKDKGLAGFYTGWWPGLAGKIPSYGLTWTLFEQIKRARTKMFHGRPAKDIENSIMGCMASATTVCIMIPMDTVKTRLVTQMNYPDLVPYKGINDCFRRVLKEEGVGAFYRGLTPRLFSVVPMIGIQFGVYEFMKKFMVARDGIEPTASKAQLKKMADEAKRERTGRLQEMAMEVAADDDQPFPAPYPQK
ncbi:hypothetical protein ACHAXH_010046 [Discostella pseudostelligera]